MISFLVPHLPKSVITSNRTSQSSGGARGKWRERAELQAITHQTIIAAFAPDIPEVACASIAVSYRCTNKKPGDGCYRPKDVPNIGGDILKAVVDAIVDAGVLEDDDRVHLPAVALGIEPVDELADEGVYVTIQELIP